jgi:TPP-dependent pyruvate/acetoin dehydrogenase alpha subunit
VRFRETTIGAGVCTAAELDELDRQNQIQLDEAVAFAETSPLPEPWELTTDVYATETEA